MITISTESYYEGMILMGVQSIITNSEDNDLPGIDKLETMTMLLGEFASAAESWKSCVARQFDIQTFEKINEHTVSRLNLLRLQCDLLGKALEDIVAEHT